jgi:hypothetical protein
MMSIPEFPLTAAEVEAAAFGAALEERGGVGTSARLLRHVPHHQLGCSRARSKHITIAEVAARESLCNRPQVLVAQLRQDRSGRPHDLIELRLRQSERRRAA